MSTKVIDVSNKFNNAKERKRKKQKQIDYLKKLIKEIEDDEVDNFDIFVTLTKENRDVLITDRKLPVYRLDINNRMANDKLTVIVMDPKKEGENN